MGSRDSREDTGKTCVDIFKMDDELNMKASELSQSRKGKLSKLLSIRGGSRETRATIPTKQKRIAYPALFGE